MTDIVWDRAKLERFRRAYENAKQSNQVQFEFEGAEFVAGYAKYLIEYLDRVLVKGGDS